MTSVLSGDALLRAWELGSGQHGEAKLATLLAVAYDEPAVAWVDQPLGAREAALLRLYETGTDGVLATVSSCPNCGTVVDVSLDVAELTRPYDREAAPGPDDDLGPGWFELRVGDRLVHARLPCASDLAAVAATAGVVDVETARTALVARCVRRSPNGPRIDSEVIAAVARELDQVDPLADVRIDVTCGECGDSWPTRLDVATIVWAQIRAHALGVLAEVDALAQRYGWSEAEILGLSPRRRLTYLDLA